MHIFTAWNYAYVRCGSRRRVCEYFDVILKRFFFKKNMRIGSF